MLSGTLLRVWICLIMRFLEIDFFKLGFLFNIPSNQKNTQSFLKKKHPSRSGGGQAGIVSRLRPFGKPGGRWTAEGGTCSGMHWMLLKSQVNGLKEESYLYIDIYIYYSYIRVYIYIYILYSYIRILYIYTCVTYRGIKLSRRWKGNVIAWCLRSLRTHFVVFKQLSRLWRTWAS